MKTNIRFVGIEAFDHHKEYLNDLVSSTIERFDLYNKFKGKLVTRKESKKYRPSADFYVCELNFIGDRRRGHLFFKKTGKTFYEVANKVFMAAEKSLRRESKTRNSRMRKLIYKPQFIENIAA